MAFMREEIYSRESPGPGIGATTKGFVGGMFVKGTCYRSPPKAAANSRFAFRISRFSLFRKWIPLTLTLPFVEMKKYKNYQTNPSFRSAAVPAASKHLQIIRLNPGESD
jgi:hypothetical protein